MEEFIQLIDYVLKSFEVGNSPQAFLVLVGLSFARIVSFVAITPFFGGTAVPAKVKIAVATSLVIITYPALAGDLARNGGVLPFGPFGFMILMVKECFVGFTLGFIAASVFEGIQMAGRFIDIQRGASMSEVMAPQLNEKVSEVGQFKFQLALFIFLFIGAHRQFIKALVESFQFIPATGFPEVQGNWTPALDVILQVSAHTLYIGVQLSLPIVMALLFTDIFFGIINRVAPQINVFFLSMPIKMMLGLFILMISLSLLKDQYIYYFIKSFHYFEFMIRYFGENKAF